MKDSIKNKTCGWQCGCKEVEAKKLEEKKEEEEEKEIYSEVKEHK